MATNFSPEIPAYCGRFGHFAAPIDSALADHEVSETCRDPRLTNQKHPIIPTCILGPVGALGGTLLHGMGFTNVHNLDDSVRAWKDDGFSTV